MESTDEIRRLWREKREKWHADIHEAYGPNEHIIYGVYDSLSQHGMYYMHFRVSNVNLEGLPGLTP